MTSAPGAYRPAADRWGPFERLARGLKGPRLAVVDARVARLHPQVVRALGGAEVVKVRAGEGAKSLKRLAEVCGRATSLPRSGTLLAIGGGTIGDLATVAAHLIKRGVRLIQVPTTLLAAVDSSLGGKGAVHLELGRHTVKNVLGAFHYHLERGRHTVKNALGAFHYAEETWLCPELFETLAPRQHREGAIEAWKMFVTLDAKRFASFDGDARALIRSARALKEAVCAEDPYETSGARRVLNFGHTLGHVIESVTGFRVSHGEAVGLGILCALDLGVAVRVTPEEVARRVELKLTKHAGIGTRRELARALRSASEPEVLSLLAGDKKVGPSGELNFVLLEQVGAASVHSVPSAVLRRLLPRWRGGR